MGKGDRRTRKGKINLGSFGNSRPKRKKGGYKAPKVEKPATTEEPAAE